MTCNTALVSSNGMRSSPAKPCNLIRARLTPSVYEELSRFYVIDRTYTFAGRKVVWPPPAYANQHVLVRNEEELVCAPLAAQP
jgi:hypothetical protein